MLATNDSRMTLRLTGWSTGTLTTCADMLEVMIKFPFPCSLKTSPAYLAQYTTPSTAISISMSEDEGRIGTLAEDSLTIDRHLLVVFFEGLFGNGLRNCHTSISYEDIELAKVFDDLCDGTLHILSFGHFSCRQFQPLAS